MPRRTAAMAGDSRQLWNERIERMSRDEMRALQLERLKRQVAYNYAGSPYYRVKFDAAGIAPADIRGFEDYTRVPLMDKNEHRQVQEDSLARHGTPFALLACRPRYTLVGNHPPPWATRQPTVVT